MRGKRCKVSEGHEDITYTHCCGMYMYILYIPDIDFFKVYGTICNPTCMCETSSTSCLYSTVAHLNTSFTQAASSGPIPSPGMSVTV